MVVFQSIVKLNLYIKFWCKWLYFSILLKYVDFKVLVGEDSWECLGLQGDQTSPSSRKSELNIHWKDWCWTWSSNPLATWCKELTHMKRSWCWERLKVGERDDRGWDGWTASPVQWTWVWVASRSWWWTGRSGVQSTESQRVRHDWATKLNLTLNLDLNKKMKYLYRHQVC